DLHRIAATPLEKLSLILFFRPVITGAVGEMMQCRTPCRMVGGVDAHMAGNIGKLADLRAPDFAIDAKIGVISQHGFRNAAALANLGIAPDCAADDNGRFVNQRFHRELGHAAALGEKAVTSMIRSATTERTSSSWKMPSMATPCSFLVLMRSTTTARFFASSEAVGSSSSNTG